ncbi:DUF2254 domain-containing protein [Hellea sp.]|nr:DUF2254 domain-containing protein [Hellea sp.]
MKKNSETLTAQKTDFKLGVSVKSVIDSFWFGPICAIILAAVIFSVCFWLDRIGAAAYLSSLGSPWDVSGDTVLELSSTYTGLVIALLALFFSITLIVLTMASSNLGIRLIDRWIGNSVIKSTLSLLLGFLTFCVLLQYSIDPSGPDSEVPRLSSLVLVVSLIPLLAWLAVAFHHLSRKIHVDTSIVKLGEDLTRNLAIRAKQKLRLSPENLPATKALVVSPKSAYLEEINYEKLVKVISSANCHVELNFKPGDFVFDGDTLFQIYSSHDIDRKLPDDLLSGIKMGGFRTDRQGAHFQIQLLSEIAARALSPAVNDLYTALTCIDHLSAALLPLARSGNAEGCWIYGSDDTPRLAISETYLTDILDQPFDVMRHAAAPYPSVSLHIIDVFRRLKKMSQNDILSNWLSLQANTVFDGAIMQSENEKDKEDLKKAFQKFKAIGE